MKATHTEDDRATIQALLERLTHRVLPNALAIKKRVDAGERLTDHDIAFLKGALEDAQGAQKFVARNPQFHDLGAQVVQLYEEIVRRAVENEKAG
jgi:hypothetical protein